MGSIELTALEQQTLLAVLRLHPRGYGVAIRDEIRRQTGRTPSIGSVYATLDRLSSKGYLKSKQGESTAERGGRRKLYFIISARGQLTLRQALQSLDALRVGTRFAGVLP